MFRESLVCAPLFFVPPDFLLNRLLRSDRKSGPHFLCREKVTKSGRGAPRAPVQGDSHPAGGARAEGLLRKARPFGAGRPSRGDQSPHVPPCPPGGNQFAQRSGANCEPAGATPPQPARCSRRNLGFRYPLGRVWEMGPKRQPGTGGVAPAGTKILSAFGFQDFIAFFCPGSILRERGTT